MRAGVVEIGYIHILVYCNFKRNVIKVLRLCKTHYHKRHICREESVKLPIGEIFGDLLCVVVIVDKRLCKQLYSKILILLFGKSFWNGDRAALGNL